jgi:putative ABC transport system permease protein
VYLPYQQIPDGYMTFHAPKDLVVRSTLPAAALLPELRRIVAAADPAQPISDVLPLSALVEAETAPRAIEVRVLGGFAAAALLLAAVGLHGLLSFTVTLRRQEIGVRMALGAVPGDILWMVLGSGARLALAGAVCGSALAYAAGRAIESLLAGVSPADAGVWTAATVLCAAMTLVGSALPAIRAARVDPAGAIRSD